jgi:sulfatase-like protein
MLVDQAFQRHLLQTQYADRLVGELIDRLRSSNLYDRSLIVVTADHGVSFRAGQPRRGPVKGNMPDIANVPLLIKTPDQHSARVDDAAVRAIDVLPTVAQLLGTSLPWKVEGIPAGRRAGDPGTPIDVDHQGEWKTTLSFGRVVAMRNARERREETLLGSSADAVYRLGSDKRLVGRRLATLDVLPAAPGQRAQVDGDADYAHVAPDSGLVPAYVSGAVNGLAPGDEVAVAIDGRVQATTRVRHEGDADVFAALVPEASLSAGSHVVAVFRVLSTTGQLRGLVPLARSAP